MEGGGWGVGGGGGTAFMKELGSATYRCWETECAQKKSNDCWGHIKRSLFIENLDLE